MTRLNIGQAVLAMAICSATFPALAEYFTPEDWPRLAKIATTAAAGVLGGLIVQATLFWWARSTAWKRRCLRNESRLRQLEADEDGEGAKRLMATTVEVHKRAVSMADVLVKMVDECSFPGLIPRGVGILVREISGLPGRGADIEEKDDRELFLCGIAAINHMSAVGAVDCDGEPGISQKVRPTERGRRIARRILERREFQQMTGKQSAQ